MRLWASPTKRTTPSPADVDSSVQIELDLPAIRRIADPCHPPAEQGLDGDHRKPAALVRFVGLERDRIDACRCPRQLVA